MLIEILNKVIVLIFFLSSLNTLRHLYYFIQSFVASTEETPVKYKLSKSSLILLGISISYIFAAHITISLWEIQVIQVLRPRHSSHMEFFTLSKIAPIQRAKSQYRVSHMNLREYSPFYDVKCQGQYPTLADFHPFAARPAPSSRNRG